MLKRVIKSLMDLFLGKSKEKETSLSAYDSDYEPLVDLENITEDDDTPREELEEPSEEDIEIAFKSLPATGLWETRQRLLLEAGFNPGPIDGKPGRQTTAAIRDFQRSRGLVVDGIWGPRTEAAIYKSPVLNIVTDGPYEDMIGPVELDDEFFNSFIDLTGKSNVLDSQGRPRRKGKRKLSSLKRFVWHQTGFTWTPIIKLIEEKKYSGHHKINAHATFDTDGSVIINHNFYYYLWTANAFNIDCISFEVMGNFEGNLGTGNWFKPDKFGRARPNMIQIIRCRQMTIWLLDPEQGPPDGDLIPAMLEWRLYCRNNDNPLKWNNTHKEATEDKPIDCGSELFYHVVRWGVESTSLTHGPRAGKGMVVEPEWWAKPILSPA